MNILKECKAPKEHLPSFHWYNDYYWKMEVCMTNTASLRSRVPGNWQARFCSRGGGSDSLAYCNPVRDDRSGSVVPNGTLSFIYLFPALLTRAGLLTAVPTGTHSPTTDHRPPATILLTWLKATD